MSPSCLHQLSNWSSLIVWSGRLVSRWADLSSALFWYVGWALNVFVSLLTSLVYLLASGVKKEWGRLGRFWRTMGMAAVATSLISSVNLWSRYSRDRLLSVSSADNSCNLYTNCFQFALSLSHLGCHRLSGTFVKASDSIITVVMWSEVRASNWPQPAMATTSGEATARSRVDP